MEEQQIQDFVHRISIDEKFRKELASDPEGVIMRGGFSPKVAQIVQQLVPHLAFDEPIGRPSSSWWH